MRRLAVRCLGIMLGVLVIAVTASVFWAWDRIAQKARWKNRSQLSFPRGQAWDIAGLLTSAGNDNVRLFVLGAQYTSRETDAFR